MNKILTFLVISIFFISFISASNKFAYNYLDNENTTTIVNTANNYYNVSGGDFYFDNYSASFVLNSSMINNTNTIGQLYNLTASMIANLTNWTQIIVDTYNFTWTELSLIQSVNTTNNIGLLYNVTASMICNQSIEQLDNFWNKSGNDLYPRYKGNLNTTGNFTLNGSINFGTEGTSDGRDIRNLMYFAGGQYGNATGDGFRIDYNYNFELANDDWLIFTKTDSNDAFPDGGIGFNFINGSGYNETVLKIYGDGRKITSTINITTEQWFNGLFNWTSQDDWNIFNGSKLDFNESKLNITASMIANLSISQNPFNYNHTLSVFDLWGIWFYNQTIPAMSYTDNRIGSINSTKNIQELLNSTGIYSTYNATYDNYAYNVSLNHTNIVFTNWNSTWDNNWLTQMLSANDTSINSTYNIGVLYNETASMIANLSISQSSLSNYWGSNGSNIYNVTALVGIGTNDPAGMFQVKKALADNGMVTFSNNGNVQFLLEDLDQADADAPYNYFQSSAGTFYIGSVTRSGGLPSSYSSRFSMDKSGNVTISKNLLVSENVGIGTTSPRTILEVNQLGTTSSDYTFRFLQSGLISGNHNTIALGKDAQGGMAGLIVYVYDTTIPLMVFNHAGDSNSLVIKKGGNVGIGTTAPAYQLEVAKSSKALNVSGFLYVNSTNIGIGTNNIASWHTNYRALEFPSTSIMFRKTTASDDIYFNSNAYYDGAWKRKIADEVAMISMGNGVIGFNVAANGAADSAITWIESMRINQSNGHVGIDGATSPKSPLSVGTNGTSSYAISAGSSSTSNGIYSEGVYAIYAEGSNTGVYGSGDIGVYGNGNNYDLYVNNGKIFSSAAFAQVGTDPMCWDGSVSSFIGDCTASSIKYKENINDLEIGLNEVLNLRAVSFDYKKSYANETRQIGFIAEEVEKISPLLVRYDENNTVYDVKYEKIQVLNTKAIQELKKENDALKAIVCKDHPEEGICL